eukprot:Filipodium_phascolosomae@DN179_c0_g1_i1.p1
MAMQQQQQAALVSQQQPMSAATAGGSSAMYNTTSNGTTSSATSDYVQQMYGPPMAVNPWVNTPTQQNMSAANGYNSMFGYLYPGQQ